MDFKKLAKFAIMAGIIVFVFGVYKYFDAETKAKQLSAPTGNYFETGFNQMAAAEQKQLAQKEAKNFLIIGGIILFIGFAVFASANKPKESDESKKELKTVVHEKINLFSLIMGVIGGVVGLFIAKLMDYTVFQIANESLNVIWMQYTIVIKYTLALLGVVLGIFITASRMRRKLK